ncbi:MAG: hypothetical protein ACRCYP_05540, partial [Alphaproteobacteria bacterium]
GEKSKEELYTSFMEYLSRVDEYTFTDGSGDVWRADDREWPASRQQAKCADTLTADTMKSIFKHAVKANAVKEFKQKEFRLGNAIFNSYAEKISKDPNMLLGCEIINAMSR